MKGTNVHGKNPGTLDGTVYGRGLVHTGKTAEYTAPDGTETVPDMECHPSCPVKALGEMSGESVTRPHGGDGGKLDTQGQGWGFTRQACNLSDTGTAARFFPCFKYQSKASTAERNWGMTSDLLRLRDDLSDEEVATLRAELQRHGVEL